MSTNGSFAIFNDINVYFREGESVNSIFAEDDSSDFASDTTIPISDDNSPIPIFSNSSKQPSKFAYACTLASVSATNRFSANNSPIPIFSNSSKEPSKFAYACTLASVSDTNRFPANNSPIPIFSNSSKQPSKFAYACTLASVPDTNRFPVNSSPIPIFSNSSSLSSQLTTNGAVKNSKSESAQDRIDVFTALAVDVMKNQEFIRFPESYRKFTRKISGALVGIGVKNNVGVFLHLKAFCGRGYNKQVRKAVWINPKGEIVPVVYKKLHKLSEAKIAIGVQNIQRELQLQSFFEHPSIVKVYSFDVYENDSKIAIYEEACDNDLLHVCKNMSHGEKLTVILDVVDALIYMHDKGFAHNDIKLNNIVIKNNKGKIADFGCCNEIGKLAFAYLRTVVPEQVGNGVIRGTIKTDVYQLGLCLWHLFHPCPPLEHLASSFIYPSSYDNLHLMFAKWDENCPMRALVKSCLADNPAFRPSMKEVQSKLQQVQSSS